MLNIRGYATRESGLDLAKEPEDEDIIRITVLSGNTPSTYGLQRTPTARPQPYVRQRRPP